MALRYYSTDVSLKIFVLFTKKLLTKKRTPKQKQLP